MARCEEGQLTYFKSNHLKKRVVEVNTSQLRTILSMLGKSEQEINSLAEISNGLKKLQIKSLTNL